jgi:hypothetical protein
MIKSLEVYGMDALYRPFRFGLCVSDSVEIGSNMSMNWGLKRDVVEREFNEISAIAAGQPYSETTGARAGLGLIKSNVGTRPMRVIAAITHQATRKACTHSATS